MPGVCWPEFAVVCEDGYHVNPDGQGTFLTSYDGTLWDWPIDVANYGPGGWEFVDGASSDTVTPPSGLLPVCCCCCISLTASSLTAAGEQV